MSRLRFHLSKQRPWAPSLLTRWRMKKSLCFLTTLLALLPLSSLQAVNVAAGKSVTLNGTFFVGDDAWAPGISGSAASVTDGVSLPEGTQWNLNTIWWNQITFPANNIVIDLGANYSITQLIAQADDNEAYLIEYWTGSAWQTAWNVPVSSGAGMRTRTSGALSFTTTQLRFTAPTASGDAYKSVSEIQAEGTLVGIPSTPDAGATVLLFALGLASLGVLRIKRRE